MTVDADICIIGSGVGGASIAWSLRDTGLSVVVVERGGDLPREPENSDPSEVFCKGRYSTPEDWVDPDGNALGISGQYHVGGASKMFGAAMFRFRPRDFEERCVEGGLSPAWPFSYAMLEPWYAKAEALFGVHGDAGADPTEGPRSSNYPYPPVGHDPDGLYLRERLVRAGVRPFSLPLAIDDGGECQRCSTCDAFPCRVDAKGDAEMRLLRPALKSPNIRLLKQTEVIRLETGPDGRQVKRAMLRTGGKHHAIAARHFVLSAGAINSARLLLASASDTHPQGLANRSGQVGRNLMLHQNSAMISVRPFQRRPILFQKTLAITDFYDGDTGSESAPRGSIQSLGKIPAVALASQIPGGSKHLAQVLLGRTVEWWLTSEDLPEAENRVYLSGGRTVIAYRKSRMAGHNALIRRWRQVMRRAGWPLSFSQTMGITGISHQCGTVRAGNDPLQAPLDGWCKAHDLENLHVVDGSFFPSSGAVNPALTIAAQALRVGDRLASKITV